MSLRLATALVAALLGTLALAQATAAPRSRGKVVRVERARGSKVPPKLCDIRSDRGGTCLGSQPSVGDVVTVLDETGVLADAKIIDVMPFTTGSNGVTCDAVWNIRTEVVRGDLSSMTARTIGLVDRDLHPQRAHMLRVDQFPSSPSGRAEDTILMAVDRDGDRTPDLVITQSQCDGSSSPCIDQWARIGTKLARVQQTNLASCGI